MLTSLLPLLYFLALIVLLVQAFRMMSKGFLAANAPIQKRHQSKGDRTGRVTVHPELLDNEGNITSEDLLTVRFSNDFDPPQPTEKPSD